jgi:hypothetical protein
LHPVVLSFVVPPDHPFYVFFTMCGLYIQG